MESEYQFDWEMLLCALGVALVLGLAAWLAAWLDRPDSLPPQT